MKALIQKYQEYTISIDTSENEYVVEDSEGNPVLQHYKFLTDAINAIDKRIERLSKTKDKKMPVLTAWVLDQQTDKEYEVSKHSGRIILKEARITSYEIPRHGGMKCRVTYHQRGALGRDTNPTSGSIRPNESFSNWGAILLKPDPKNEAILAEYIAMRKEWEEMGRKLVDKEKEFIRYDSKEIIAHFDGEPQ